MFLIYQLFCDITEHQTADITEEIEKLLIIENFGNFELLLKNSEKLIKRNKDIDIQNMVQMIVRKYLLCNPNLTFSQKQQMIDKVFGNESRKTFMFPNKK